MEDIIAKGYIKSNKEESAVQYLELAKKISKEAFSMFKNRIWKRMHGIPLTEEEKRELLESLELYFKVFFLDEDAAGLIKA